MRREGSKVRKLFIDFTREIVILSWEHCGTREFRVWMSNLQTAVYTRTTQDITLEIKLDQRGESL